MTRQLVLDLPLRAALGRDSFFVSSANRLAVAALDGWRDWPGGRMLLIGPAGAGKTHLAHVWAAETGAGLVPAAGLHRRDLPALARTALVLEDADRLADPADEVALFHLHNMLAARGMPLLLTAAVPVRDWALTLPDLASRMQAIATTRLAPPDDSLLAAVLVKLFSDRQISVTPALITYLLGRMDRSIAAAGVLVSQLDALSLAQGRPVNRALARTLLDRTGPEL